MHRLGALLLIGMGALLGCTTSEVLIPHAVELTAPAQSLPEEELLDVGIVLFDAGVPEGRIEKSEQEQLLEQGIYAHIRRAEAVYMAVQLRDALQRSGQWGMVLVTPEQSTAADLSVNGRIVQSDGDTVRVEVEAVDAAGRTWLDEEYDYRTPAAVYDTRRYAGADPYQDLFYSIANDLAAVRARLPGEAARRIRTIAELRYAGELSPTAFDGYVEQDGRGMHRPVRLPAIDDPMFRYVKNVRQREQVFLQTLDLHYESFASRAAASYGSWREAAREESMTMRELKRSVRWRRALGIAAVVASIASSMNGGIGDGPTGRLIQDSLMMMGAGVLDMGNLRQEEIRLHADILEEVSQSFDDEVKPLVVDIAGTQHRLTGTAQMQYAEWRELLQRVFAEQAGIVRPENVERHEICFESEPKDQTATAGC